MPSHKVPVNKQDLRMPSATVTARTPAPAAVAPGGSPSVVPALLTTPGGAPGLKAGTGVRKTSKKVRKPVAERLQSALPKGAANQGDTIDSLRTLWIVESDIDADLRFVVEPQQAYPTQQSNAKPATMCLKSGALPGPPRQNLRHQVAFKVWTEEYTTEDFTFVVQLVNDPTFKKDEQNGINRQGTFEILDYRPRSCGGALRSRLFTGKECWAPNPRYVADSGFDIAAEAAACELLPQDMVAACPPGFTELDSPDTMPFIFFIDGTLDPKFMINGQRHTRRKTLDMPGFQKKLEQARLVSDQDSKTGVTSKVFSRDLIKQPAALRADKSDTTYVLTPTAYSHRPATKRAGNRVPGTTMRNPAHLGAIGFEQRQGHQGVLASHEWCHLIGDGDGGNCTPGNLVVGTNAVNTEQLAMETALRPFRLRFAQRGIEIQLTVTAIVRPTYAILKTMADGAKRARWIRYKISLKNAQDRTTTVHQQVMHASRGVITKGEFAWLEHHVASKLEKAQSLMV